MKEYLSKKEQEHAAPPAKVWQQTDDRDVIHGLNCFVRRLADIGPSSPVRLIPHGSEEFHRIAAQITPPGVRA